MAKGKGDLFLRKIWLFDYINLFFTRLKLKVLIVKLRGEWFGYLEWIFKF